VIQIKNGKNSTGIEFTGRNRITIKNKILVSTKLMILQYLLIITGVYGTLFSFISGLEISVNKPLLFAAIIVVAFVFYILFRIPVAMKFGIPLIILIYLYAGYEFFAEIVNGFYYLENYIIAKLNNYFNLSILKYLVGAYDSREVVTIFLIFVVPIICFLACAVIVRNTMRVAFIFTTMPLVLFSFIVGYIPESLPFAAYLIGIICLVGMGTTMKEKHRILSRKNLREVNKIGDRLLEQNFKYIIGFKIGALLSCILLLLLLTASLIISPIYPKQADNIKALKKDFQTKIVELSTSETYHYFDTIQVFDFNLMPGNANAGGLSNGQLESKGEVSFNYNTALRVDAPDVGTSIYLKGYAGSIYEDNRWKELSTMEQDAYKKLSKEWNGTSFQIGDQSGYLLSLIQSLSNEVYTDLNFSFGQVKVDSINADPNYVYIPYFSLFGQESSLNLNREDYITSKKKQKTYTFGYFNTFSNLYDFNENADYVNCLNVYQDKWSYTNEEKEVLIKLKEYHTFEAAYRKYVNNTYLQVPSHGLEQLKSEFSNKGIAYYKTQYSNQALSTLISDVRNRIQKDTVYSLNPGTIPQGKDYIQYFLYDNKKGYCSHYASTAAMIFRIMGVPARYVEGYIIKTDNINKGKEDGSQTMVYRMDGDLNTKTITSKAMDIKDANAHAWVEIYVDGLGWVPVEMTPSSAIEANYAQDNPAGKPIQSEEDKSSGKENTASAENDGETEDKQTEDKQSEDNQTDKDNVSKDTKELNKDKNRLDKNKTSKPLNPENTEGYTFYLKKAGRVTFWSIILFLGILIGILLRFIFIMSKRKNLRNKPMNHDKKVLFCYQEMNKILEYNRINLDHQKLYRESALEAEKAWQSLEPGSFQKFIDIALKAKFSKDLITTTELNEAEEFYKKVIGKLYENKTPFERLYLKFIKIFHI